VWTLRQAEEDNYSLAYAEFTVPLVKAVQEQQQIILQQQKLIVDLQKKIEKITNALNLGEATEPSVK
jgi:hypothetical protein